MINSKANNVRYRVISSNQVTIIGHYDDVATANKMAKRFNGTVTTVTLPKATTRKYAI